MIPEIIPEDESLWRPETVADTLSKEDVDMMIVRLQCLASDPNYAQDRGYSIDDFFHDVTNVMLYMGSRMKPEDIQMHIEDPDRRARAEGIIAHLRPYQLTAPVVIPQSLANQEDFQHRFRPVHFDRVVFEIGREQLECRFFDDKYIHRIGFEFISRDIPRMVFIIPSKTQEVVFVDSESGTQGFSAELIDKYSGIAAFVNMHMMIAAASLVGEVNRINEKEAEFAQLL